MQESREMSGMIGGIDQERFADLVAVYVKFGEALKKI
jgi:hypothetical protein